MTVVRGCSEGRWEDPSVSCASLRMTIVGRKDSSLTAQNDRKSGYSEIQRKDSSLALRMTESRREDSWFSLRMTEGRGMGGELLQNETKSDIITLSVIKECTLS